MAPKRPKSEPKPSSPSAHPPPNKRSKPHHRSSPNHTTTAPAKPPISINSTKSQIRSLTRLLSNPTPTTPLPATVLVEKERQLALLHTDLTAALAAQKRSQIIGKYHKIRFFERQKATRALKKAQRDVALWSSWLEEKEGAQGVGVDDGKGGGKMERLRREVGEREVDLQYTLYYPLSERYVGLFPPRKREGEGEVGQDGAGRSKPPVWEVVARCMREGRLEALREGRLGVKPDGSVRTGEESEEKKSLKSREWNKRERRGEKGEKVEGEEKEGSDGGFFED